jgi:HD-GYP domain-containing protein (c-di-GMP phosphodiesterase class II)
MMIQTLPLPLHFLDEEKPLAFDVYLQLGGKPVLYCRRDDVSLKERLVKLKAKKNLDHFLVLKEDYEAVIRYLSQGLKQIFETHLSLSLHQQVSAIYLQQRGLLLILSAAPSSKENFSILRSTCEPFYDFFVQNPQGLEALYQVEYGNEDFDLWLTHSVRVAALSSVLIERQKTDEPGKPIFDLIMGAFVHDFAFLKTPWKLREGLNPQEDLTYKNHPAEGVTLLDFDHVNPWVRSVILKHEEHIDGSGFPTGVREQDLDQALLCINVANAFDRLKTLQNLTFDEALKKILIDKLGAYPLEFLQTLQSIIKSIS